MYKANRQRVHVVFVLPRTYKSILLSKVSVYVFWFADWLIPTPNGPLVGNKCRPASTGLEKKEKGLIEFVERKRDWHGRFGAYLYWVVHIAAAAVRKGAAASAM